MIEIDRENKLTWNNTKCINFKLIPIIKNLLRSITLFTYYKINILPTAILKYIKLFSIYEIRIRDPTVLGSLL